jgi:hypothetical protein
MRNSQSSYQKKNGLSLVVTKQKSWRSSLFSTKKPVWLTSCTMGNPLGYAYFITNNACRFLSMEITRLEKEMNLQIKLREQTVDRLKKEVNLLRRRLLNLSREKVKTATHASLSEHPATENGSSGVDRQEYDLLRKRY